MCFHKACPCYCVKDCKQATNRDVEQNSTVCCETVCYSLSVTTEDHYVFISLVCQWASVCGLSGSTWGFNAAHFENYGSGLSVSPMYV